ncbi:hypothetical protein ACE103_09885 [Bradyrhizobium sp. ma5]|uniref:hypothetical protein n=1 Tax=Bradyrhizobium sp. ma5 TaxID=3344828 RepID=UPI0035D41607
MLDVTSVSESKPEPFNVSTAAAAPLRISAPDASLLPLIGLTPAKWMSDARAVEVSAQKTSTVLAAEA